MGWWNEPQPPCLHCWLLYFEDYRDDATLIPKEDLVVIASDVEILFDGGEQ